jgi:hypothetical protein
LEGETLERWDEKEEERQKRSKGCDTIGLLWTQLLLGDQPGTWAALWIFPSAHGISRWFAWRN